MPSGSILSGSLVKRGRFVKNWNLRYFELYDHELVYYQHEGGKLKGRFEISEATVFEESLQAVRPFCFSVTNPATGDALLMAASDASSRDVWIESLVNVIATCRQKGKKSAMSNRLVDMPEELLFSSKSVLSVKIIQCCDLLDKGTGGTSSPYVSVTLGSYNAKTTTRGWCLSPQWGMLFDLEFDRTARYLKIDVFHNSTYKTDQQSRKDDFLGCVHLPLLPIIAGYHHRGWYQLRKRSSRSHVRGSIEMEIICRSSPRVSYEPYRMYHKIRMLPELRTTIAKVRSGDKDKRFESKLTNNELREYVQQSQNAESFPFQFPPVESEVFEDFAVKVSLLSTSSVCLPEAAAPESRMILIDGMVVLTNYRLIFVSLTRLSNTIDVFDDNEMLSCDSSPEAESMNFATHVYLSNIMDVVLASGTDLGIAGISGLSDVLRIKVSDGRKLSLVFHDSGSSVYAATSTSGGRKASVLIDGEETMTSPIALSAGSGKGGAASSPAASGLSSGFMKMTKLMSAGTAAGADSAPVTKQPSTAAAMSNQNTGYDTALHNCDFLSTMNYILASLAKNEFSSEASKESNEHSNFLSLQRLLVVCTKMDADDTEEGPPCSRIHQRLCYRINNRLIEKDDLLSINARLLACIQDSLGPDMGDAEFGDGGESEWRNASADCDIEVDAPCLTSGLRMITQCVEETYSETLSVKGLHMRLKQAPLSVKMLLQQSLYGGWCVFDPFVEYSRMGVPNDQWRFTNCNTTYGMCETYPQHLVVPASADDAVILGSANFRSKARLPALAWRDTKTLCTICRCSQPLVGIGSKRSKDDERLVAEINRCSGIAGSNKPFVIVDARPLLNAQANQAVGKGYESSKLYENTRILFMGIPNIHVVRKSYEVLLEEAISHCNHDYMSWLRVLETSGWLSHLQRILAAVVRMVHYIRVENISLLVHCSDGWDRTAQLTSLSMLLMDRYYRTLTGFMVLVEKEWISFGHQFGHRHAWTETGWKDQERSPIFMQFLDCVHQCVRQHPDNYEFNEDLLLFIAEHVSSGLFGNFFGNFEKERKEVKDSSISIWVYVDNNRERFTNRNSRLSETEDMMHVPVVSPKKILLWDRWFLKWHDQLWNISWMEAHEDQQKEKPTTMGETMSHMQANWASDMSTNKCSRCQLKFTIYFRKHHCRSCGMIFCEHCCSEQRIVLAISATKTQRCCIECVKKIDMVKLDAAGDVDSGLTGQLDEQGNIILEKGASPDSSLATMGALLKRIPTMVSNRGSTTSTEPLQWAQSAPAVPRAHEPVKTTSLYPKPGRPASIKVVQQQLDKHRGGQRPVSKRMEALLLDIPLLASPMAGVTEDYNSDSDSDSDDEMTMDTPPVKPPKPLGDKRRYLETPAYVEDDSGHLLRRRSKSICAGDTGKEGKHISSRYMPVDPVAGGSVMARAALFGATVPRGKTSSAGDVATNTSTISEELSSDFIKVSPSILNRTVSRGGPKS